MTDENFELRLIEALQPVRGFALAHGIYHLFASGIYDRLDGAAAGVDDLAKTLEMNPARVAGFLRFLANEDLVSLREDTVTLTARGQGMGEFRPWYELLVGGYAQTFEQITDTLRQDGYASRDGRMVGIGSCGISQYDALPLVRQLLADMPTAPEQIIDIGCGDGQFLTALLPDYPGVRAVGVDPYAPLDSDRGDTGAGGTLTFHRGSAVDYVRSLDTTGDERPCRLFIAAFLLQEILEQDGRETVVEMVREIVSDGRYLAVVEVDHQPANPAIMRHGLGLAYYNPYYVLHVLTEQRLETRKFWSDLFEDAGARVISQRAVRPEVDSTGLEFGCLLTSR